MHLIAHSGNVDLVDAVCQALYRARGSYSIVFMSESHVIAARDPYGLRPLCLGRLGRSWVVCSESVGFDLIDAETGLIVARFEERRKNKKPKGASVSDAAGPWPWAAMWAETAAGDLCRELERIGSDVS